MSCDYIVRGSDFEASVQLLDNGTPVNLLDAESFPYDIIEIVLVDRYGKELANYKTPSTAGYLPLDRETDPHNGNVLFNGFKSDSVNFTKGDIYAKVFLIDSSKAEFENGYKLILDLIYLAEVK